MKHINTIEKIKTILPRTSNIDVALLYGSYARKEALGNSDLDIKLVVDENFDIQNFIAIIKNGLDEAIKTVHYIKLRNKVVVYFKELPKLEFGLCYSIEAINRDFLGSEITELKDIVLYEKDKARTQIESYLKQLIASKKAVKTSDINNLIDKFMYEFESCSSKHSRSDGYQFYYFYNIAFHIAIQLNYLAKGKTAYYFLPKNFMTSELSAEAQASFSKLNGATFLPEGNKRKRALLDFFYSAIEQLVPINKYNEIKAFCEWVYERDFFWNFRDANAFNTKMINQLVYRTSALALFQNTEELNVLLRENNIKTIIDLRADREIEAISYSDEVLSQVKYVKAQFDPWDQPEWFKEKHNEGSNHEIAYRFFAMGCKDSIKKTFETILEEETGAIAIHCHAGKDRTGIIFSLLHLLLGSPIDNLNTDYLTSEMDVSLDKLKIALDVVENEGGIVKYLMSCGLTEKKIGNLKIKLLNE
ncbi:tyrosine-protein phosphatase [Algibacter lectus]|uniref:tyrosine-protein phosphatase n=1 Tax=Algibacter lectus TaxID=221126 RepID=UPI0024943E9F|nr:tyrosine-protein phosphatase [Algibacter lectus]